MPKKETRVPIGKAIVWSKDDLKQMGVVNPKDIALAKLYWRRLAHRRYRNVLDTAVTADSSGRAAGKMAVMAGLVILARAR